MKVAEGFGFNTARITSEDQIEAVLSEAIGNPGANFIEIMVPSQDKIVPFVPSWVNVAKERERERERAPLFLLILLVDTRTGQRKRLNRRKHRTARQRADGSMETD